MAKKKVKMSEVGPQTYRQLQQLNDPNYNESLEINSLIGALRNLHPITSPVDPYYTAEQDVMSNIALQSGSKDYWGNSMFDDKEYATPYEFERLGDIRAEELPWYAKIGAGVGKMGTTAVTTFLSGTLGLAYGLTQAAVEGDASYIWNNKLMSALEEINRGMEDILPNYYTQDEIENPMAWGNIFSANFLGDKVIKNLGFAIGAFYGGSLASTAIRAARLPKLLSTITHSNKVGKFATGLVGSTVQAAGEAAIEATSGVKDFKETNLYEYDSNIYLPAYEQALLEYESNKNKQIILTSEGAWYDPAYVKFKNTVAKLDENRSKYSAELDREVEKMGDRIFLWNMGILVPSGLIQQGRIFARGMEGYRSPLNIRGAFGDYSSASTKLGVASKIVGNSLIESSEESLQGLAQVAEGNITKANLNAFIEAGMDPDANRETVDKMNIIQQSIVEHFGSDRQKEEALIGGIIGALGIPTISRRKSGRIGPRLQGGMFSEISEYMQQKDLETKESAKLNEYVNSGKMQSYYEGLVRHVKFENDKLRSAINNDTDAFEDADFNLLISDVIMFDRAGKLGDLTTMVEHLSDTSDEALEDIIESTSTINESGELVDGLFVDTSGNPMNSTEEGKQQMINIINSNRDQILNAVEQYRKIKNDIEIETDGLLSSSQLEELIWLKMRALEHKSKQKDTIKSIKDKFLSVYEFLPEDYLVVNNTKNIITSSPSVLSSNEIAEDLSRRNVDLLESVLNSSGIDPDFIDDLINDFNTIKRHLEKIKEFETTFEKYKKDPQGHAEHISSLREQAVKREEKKVKLNVTSTVAQTPVSDLNNSEEDLDSILDQIESLETSTLEEEDLKNKAVKNINTAKAIRSFSREAHRAIDNSEVSEEVKQAAHTAIDNSSKTANSVDELLDVEGVAFNDPNLALNNLTPEELQLLQDNADESLDIIAKLEELTRDVRTLMEHKINPELEVLAEQMESLPNDIEELIEEESPQTGHDPVSKSVPVNKEMIPKEEEHQPTPNLGETEVDSVNDLLLKSNFNTGVKFSTVWKTFTTDYPIGFDKNTSEELRNPAEMAKVLNRISEKILSNEPLTSEEQEIKNKYTDIYGVIPTYTEQEIKRMRAVYDYLQYRNAFLFSFYAHIDDEIIFVSDPKLNEEAGDIVILIALRDKYSNALDIIGDIISKSELNRVVKGKRISDNNPGLEEFIERFEKSYTPENGLFIFDETTHVNSKMVGKPKYGNTRRYLNDIFEVGDDFQLGIIRGKDTTRMLLEPDARASDNPTKRERGVIMPRNPKPGQPFVMLRTSDMNRLMPVSFTMDPYDRNTENTGLGKMVDELLGKISEINIIDFKNRFKDLLSVKDVFLDRDDLGNISLTIIPVNSDNRVSVYKGPITDTIVSEIKTELYGTPFQVSKKYINSTIFSTVTNEEVDYNRLIGEIAKTNLDYHRTVNDWFVLNPIDSKGEEVQVSKPSHRFNRSSSTQDNTSGKKSTINNVYSYADGKINVNTDTWEVTDEKGNPIKDVSLSNKFRAYVYGLKNGLLLQEYYDTEWGRYNPKKADFIKVEVEEESFELPNPEEVTAKPIRSFGGNISQSKEDNSVTQDLQTDSKLTLSSEQFQEQQIAPENQISNTQKALELGLLDEPIRELIFSVLNEEQQNAILTAKKAKRSLLLKKLENSFDSEANTFDEDVDTILGIDGKYRQTDISRKVWDKKKELKWLNRVLPQLNKEGRVRIVDSLIRIPNSNKKAWGRFKKGIIDIYDRAASGTLIHEAFHAITDMLLTRQERKDLFSEARKKYGEMKMVKLEENLAEDFRRYVLLEETPFIGLAMKMFRKIKHIISKIRGNEPIIDGLFYRIQRGKLANQELFDSTNIRYAKSKDIGLYIDQLNWLKNRATLEEYNKVFRLRTILKKALFDSKDEVISYMRNIHNINYSNYKIILNRGKYYAAPLLDMLYSDAIRLVSQSIEDAYYEDLSADEILSREALEAQDELFREEEYTEEMQEIKEKAIADGTFMKAPNGNPTNLNERQWLQVRTKNFINWFGDWINDPSNASKVVDENGEPMVVYHSTDAEFNIFDNNFNHKANRGFFFTDDEIMGHSYGKKLMPVFLNIRDAYEFNGNGRNWNDLYVDLNSVISKLEDKIEAKNINWQDYAKRDIINLTDYDNWYKEVYQPLEYLRDKSKKSFIDFIRKHIIRKKLLKYVDSPTLVESTRKIEKILQQINQDSNIIFHKITDYGPRHVMWNGAHDVFVITNPNNVKSAEYNEGPFSRFNNDIRYRVADYITEDTPQEERELLEHSERFLANFGITIEELKNYDSKEPLFDSINKVIYFKNIDDLTDNVGYAIAFMMQYNPIVKDLISYRLVQPKSVKRSLLKRSDYSPRISDRVYKDMNKTLYLKDIGKDIAQELKRIFNVAPKPNHNAFLYRLNQLISLFFDLFSYNMKKQYEVINKFARDVANNIKLNDYTSILLSKNKPGTKSKAELVTLDKAFEDNPYEESIIRNLNKFDISLGGSASMAVQGTIYRPTENPMHDIDFNAKGKTEQEIESIIQELYPYNHLKNTIVNGNDKTLTYIIMDRPYEVIRPIEGIAEYVIIDSVTKEVIGSYIGSELTLKEGVKGKILDFFIGEKKYPNILKKVNGKTYLFANAKEALEAKLDWTRLKDIWDYNRFVPFTMQEVLEAERAAQEQEFKNKFESAKIIWGHPAIGKTTYLEKHQDILEWDQEVNPKRNEFIKQLIDPDGVLDDQTFFERRLEYMANLSPEYKEFLTTEWENLKNRALRENKKLFASPLPLLKLFPNDFDLVINFSTRSFYESNTRRGSTYYGSVSWKQAINDVLVLLPQEKVYTTEKYFSELMQDYTQQQETSIQIYQLTKYDYNNLSQEDKQYLQDRNISVEEYMKMSRDEKEVLLHCKP